MAEELKNLIEKIQKDGLDAAKKKAGQIEEESREKAASAVEDAKKEAALLIDAAKKRIEKEEKSSHESLKQAGRDFLLVLHKQIESVLDKIISTHIKEAVKGAELAEIIKKLILAHKKDAKDITVLVAPGDLKKLENTLLKELKDEISKGLNIEASDDIGAGFAISYDDKKSRFDFTDKALAGYISTYLKPKLKEIFEKK